MKRLTILPVAVFTLAGFILRDGVTSPLHSQVVSHDLRTRNMELVGYNGEIAAKTPDLIQLHAPDLVLAEPYAAVCAVTPQRCGIGTLARTRRWTYGDCDNPQLHVIEGHGGGHAA